MYGRAGGDRRGGRAAGRTEEERREMAFKLSGERPRPAAVDGQSKRFCRSVSVDRSLACSLALAPTSLSGSKVVFSTTIKNRGTSHPKQMSTIVDDDGESIVSERRSAVDN